VITIAVFGVLVSSTYINDEAMQTMTDNISEPPVITEEVIEESPQADRLQWPDEVPIKQSREMAFSDLFGLWEVTFQAEENFSACNQAEANGLLCYEGIGSLNKLRNLNRPAVLRMFNDQGTKYYVNLISLKKDTAVITVGSKTLEVTLKDINSRWLGNYILLWRVPDAYRGAIRPGNQNPSVRWLETMLASIQGREPVAGENMVFDKELVKKVKEFQLKEGLVPDGIVGVQTFIHLNTAANNNVPTLTQQEDKL
jgi:general secretion pathway protein A